MFTIDQEDRLPQSLSAYYQEARVSSWFRDCAADLPLVIAALSTAEEPLTDEALASLKASPWEEDHLIYLSRVDAALRVGDSLIRHAPNADGERGSTIYHQSFREFVIGRLGDNGQLISQPCSSLVDTLDEARKRLWRAALQHSLLGANQLGRHLHRWGTEYLLWWAPNGMSLAAERLLDLDLTIERLEHADLNEINDWIHEFTLIDLEGDPLSPPFKTWAHFMKTRAAAMRRPLLSGSDVERFVQLALEHAESSVLTQSVESSGRAQPAIRSLNRPKTLHTQTLLNVIDLGENSDRINERYLHIDDDLMIISVKKTLIYQIATGQLLHTFDLRWPKLLSRRRLLLNHQELWSLESMTCLASMDFAEFGGEDFGLPDTLVCFEGDRIVFIRIDDGGIEYEIAGQFISRRGAFKTKRFVLLLKKWTMCRVGHHTENAAVLSKTELSAKQLVEVHDHGLDSLRVVSGSALKAPTWESLTWRASAYLRISLPARCKVYPHRDKLICVEQYAKRSEHFVGVYREHDLHLIDQYCVSTASFRVNQHDEKYEFTVIEDDSSNDVDSRSVTAVSGDRHDHWPSPLRSSS